MYPMYPMYPFFDRVVEKRDSEIDIYVVQRFRKKLENGYIGYIDTQKTPVFRHFFDDVPKLSAYIQCMHLHLSLRISAVTTCLERTQ